PSEHQSSVVPRRSPGGALDDLHLHVPEEHGLLGASFRIFSVVRPKTVYPVAPDDPSMPFSPQKHVAELIEAITTWGSHWNDDPAPFIWHATAAEIIETVQRGRVALNRQT